MSSPAKTSEGEFLRRVEERVRRLLQQAPPEPSPRSADLAVVLLGLAGLLALSMWCGRDKKREAD